MFHIFEKFLYAYILNIQYLQEIYTLVYIPYTMKKHTVVFLTKFS